MKIYVGYDYEYDKAIVQSTNKKKVKEYLKKYLDEDEFYIQEYDLTNNSLIEFN